MSGAQGQEVVFSPISGLRTEVKKVDFAFCVSCAGTLTDDNASAFLREVRSRILRNGHRFLIFDLQKVQRASPLGVGVFAYLVSWLQKSDGQVVFLPFSRDVDRTSSLLGFQPFFKFATRTEEAIRIFNEQINRCRVLENFKYVSRRTRKRPSARSLQELQAENRRLRRRVRELQARLKVEGPSQEGSEGSLTVDKTT
jgi:anti-anti-sigma factor